MSDQSTTPTGGIMPHSNVIVSRNPYTRRARNYHVIAPTRATIERAAYFHYTLIDCLGHVRAIARFEVCRILRAARRAR